MRKLKPPKDIKAWWRAPHCGPGSTDTTDDCGFCGRNVIECAEEHSESVNERHHQLGDDAGCGGCGFWCKGCGRFWAQGSCGESNYQEHVAADGAELYTRSGYVYCVCGKKLMKEYEECT